MAPPHTEHCMFTREQRKIKNILQRLEQILDPSHPMLSHAGGNLLFILSWFVGYFSLSWRTQPILIEDGRMHPGLFSAEILGLPSYFPITLMAFAMSFLHLRALGIVCGQLLVVTTICSFSLLDLLVLINNPVPTLKGLRVNYTNFGPCGICRDLESRWPKYHVQRTRLNQGPPNILARSNSQVICCLSPRKCS